MTTRRHIQRDQLRRSRSERLRCLVIANLIVILACSGCRSIVKFGESRQSVAARRLSRQGLKAARQGEWSVAEALFSESLDVSDLNDAAHRGLAETLWQRGRRQEALTHLEKAVRLSAGDPKHLQRLGRIYLELGRVDDASRQCEIAMQSDRDWAALWVLWGDCEVAQGRPDSALAAYHRALSLQPDYPYAQMQSAEIYHQQKRYDRLLATLDRLDETATAVLANQTDGGLVPGRADLLRGLAMRELGRPLEARRYLVAAVEKNPTDVTTRLQLAAFSIADGDPTSAQTWLTQAMQIDPEAVAASGWVRSGISASLAVDPLATSIDEVMSLPKSTPTFSLPTVGGPPVSRSRVATGPSGLDNR